MFKIERNIPLPPPKTIPRPSKYPWHIMNVGDSFFVGDSTRDKISSIASWIGKRHNMKFAIRPAQHGGKDGFRVWRVE